MNMQMEWIGGGVSMLTTAEIEQCSLDTALIGKRIKKARKEASNAGIPGWSLRLHTNPYL